MVTFENHSPAWNRVTRMTVTFGGPEVDAGVLVPSGEALQSWGRATVQREPVRTKNEQLVLTAVTNMGTVLAQDAHFARSSSPFPETHLLEVPFSIPPNMFARRWILLNTGPTSPCVTAMLLDFDLENGHRERLWLDFRSTRWGSYWQRHECGPVTHPIHR